MLRRRPNLETRIATLDHVLAEARPRAGNRIGMQIDRWRGDAGALRFHLSPQPEDRPILLAILGGTGTGKSTLVNRLLEANLSAASFRRTYTAGAVAVAASAQAVPPGWLGREHRVADPSELPVRGAEDALVVVPLEHEFTRRLTLIDTPDLDGDQPLHHAQADRVFRWAQAVLFLVTPEKYQMTELLPYYRLVRRYALPMLFAMNKVEEPAQVEDYQRVLIEAGFDEPAQEPGSSNNPVSPRIDEPRRDMEERGRSGAGLRPALKPLPVFAIPRDDAAYEPSRQMNLQSLRETLQQIERPSSKHWQQGLGHRMADLAGRVQDQILNPLQQRRKVVDQIVRSVRALETPVQGVDVNPVTLQLQRRMQQKSVLYLMGPRRILDRVRQVPSLLARLPRTTWDLVMKGQAPESTELEDPSAQAQAPDFAGLLTDQFRVMQSRIEDVVRSYPEAAHHLEDHEEGLRNARLAPESAGAIADEELGELRKWLEERWNATPRDTLLLQKLLKHLPGGQRLTQWSEAAPYLLVVVTVMNNAFLGPIDLIAIGGYSIFTWLTERLSNEVTARTRQTNRRITDRFSALVHDQINRTVEFLQLQAPAKDTLIKMQHAVEGLQVDA
jgi:hypothetical protein